MSSVYKFKFLSSDGKTHLNVTEWIPDRNPAAVLQIIHGIAEHAGRYERFASYMADNGIFTVIFDLVGHGKSAEERNELGYLPDKEGWMVFSDDTEKLRAIEKQKHPDIPYIILGHSMGAFILRTYMISHSRKISGAILSGDGCKPDLLLDVGIMTAESEIKKNGGDVKSEKLKKLSMGKNNSRIDNIVNGNEWLSRDNTVSDMYTEDKLCDFLPGAVMYRELFKGIKYAQNRKNLAKIDADIPVLMISGECDPVGDYGKGARKVKKLLEKAGVKNIKSKFYPGGRHEMLNEINKEEVYEEILGWIAGIISGKQKI